MFSTNRSTQGQGMAVLFVIFLLMCSSVTAAESRSPYISSADLSAALKTQNIDQILQELNSVKRMDYQGQILPFVRDLWDNRKEQYSDLPWALINSPIIRVNVADILLQAAVNGKIGIDQTALHRYVADQINSPDVDVAVNAIGALGTVDDEKDVPRILEIAKRQQEGTFRVSVIALSNMCNPLAARALDELKTTVTKPELKSFITITVSQSQSFKKRTHWCDAK